MKSIWIYFLLFSIILSRSLTEKLCDESKAPCYSEDVDNNRTNELDVINSITLDARILSMEQQLDKIYELAKQNIRSSLNNSTNTADVIKRLIDANVTGILEGYPASCPPFSTAQVIYTVKVTDLDPFPVFCDMQLAGAGWTVIQRRIDGNLNFYRNWAQYKQGFGNISSEFFIGLDKLHAITANSPHELYIYLEDFEENTRFARYEEFLISNELEFYELKKLGRYSGNAGESLSEHLNAKFSTFDNPRNNCAEKEIGAWWYSYDCGFSSLNGLYLNGDLPGGLSEKGIYWHHWKGTNYSYKSVQMMIRPKCPCSYSI